MNDKVVHKNEDNAINAEDSWRKEVAKEEELAEGLDENSSIKLQEYVEVISTDDERIKVIGEELANKTGRDIFAKICQGSTSSIDISKSLNISLPLVNWHINRLLSVGIIQIEKIAMSSRNRGMKYYGPTKTVLVIMPPEQKNGMTHVQFRKIVEKLTHNIMTVLYFVSAASATYLVANALANQGGTFGGIQVPSPGTSTSAAGSLELIFISLFAGSAVGICAHFLKKFIEGTRKK